MKKILILTLCLILLTGCGKSETSEAMVSVSADGSSYSVEFDPGTRSSGTVFKDGYEYRYEYKGSDELILTYPDGQSFTFRYNGNSIAGMASPDFDNKEWLEPFELENIVDNATGQKSSKSEGRGQIFLGILLIISGCIMMFATNGMWMLKHGWKYKNAEPSEMYLVLTKIGGGIVTFIGIMAIISAL